MRLSFRELALSGTEVHTDQVAVYAAGPGVVWKSVNHSKEQYGWNGVTANTIEALLRRAMMGTHCPVDRKHLPRYMAEVL